MNPRRIYMLILLAGIGAVAGMRCGSDKGCTPVPPEFRVVPDSVTVNVSSSKRFEAVFDGETPKVLWHVDDVLGGSPETGMITPGGLYVAPPEVPPHESIRVTAVALGDTLLAASATIIVHRGESASSVEVTPSSATAAVLDSVKFFSSASGCSFDDPIWTIKVISGQSSEIGLMRANGTYLAPASPGGNFELMVMAHSGSCIDKTGIAKVIVKMPTQFYVELEDFTDSWGDGIRKGVACGGGSVGVSGLDVAGEWISVPVTVPAGGPYLGRIKYAAGYNDALELTVAAEGCRPDGTGPTTTFVLDEGTGVGG